jgi:sugar phosphate isomerase/epimerase
MELTRRTVLSQLAAAAAMPAAARPTKDDISLAAWSINRSFFVARKWRNADLPRICRELNINGLEFVNQFFENPMKRSLDELKKSAADHGIKLVLIMVDGEGDMAAADRAERMAAARAHRKWIDVAHYLGCHAIRCNLGGSRQGWKEDQGLVDRAAESFRDLLAYAKGAGLNVVIENHGGASSDGDTLARLMKTVNDPDFGTLPDFGNTNPGDDPYEVMRKILPWAKGVSVKAMWAEDGTHPRYDLEKMIRISMDAGYHGFWGIESSFGRGGRGADLPHDQIWENELKGVRLTRDVIERVVLKRS